MRRTPGFSAEAALRRGAGARYAAITVPRGDPAGRIVPQDTVDDVLDVGCAVSCSAACNVAIVGGYKAWSDCLDACFKFCG
jgi:hypothetical protein